MKAAIYKQTGAASEVLQITKLEIPAPGEDEVLVKLHTSGINPTDTKTRAGIFPIQGEWQRIVPHHDGAGGLPLMFSRRQRNVFLSIGICLTVAIAFSLATLTCQSLGGLNLLRPTLAAWLPIMVFLPVAVGMSHTLRT